MVVESGRGVFAMGIASGLVSMVVESGWVSVGVAGVGGPCQGWGLFYLVVGVPKIGVGIVQKLEVCLGFDCSDV